MRERTFLRVVGSFDDIYLDASEGPAHVRAGVPECGLKTIRAMFALHDRIY